ncbi:hypothetical protein [Methylosinus sp. sav-2]|uniref:hypothetical protein n=1 Tax=Methylosinus sp. sav-2 TaxID=2485168 RepID=UPI00047BA147|nr:hypothetical protein [Methylosinus sp. sav-2]
MAVSDARFCFCPRGLIALVAVILFLQSFAVSAAGIGHMSADGPAFQRLCAKTAVDGPAANAAAKIGHRFCSICAAIRGAEFLRFNAPWRASTQDAPAPRRARLALPPPGWMSSWSSQAPPCQA